MARDIMLWCIDVLLLSFHVKLLLHILLFWCLLDGALKSKVFLDHARLSLFRFGRSLFEESALDASLETSARFKCEQKDVECDVCERDAQVNDAEVAPEMSLAHYVCKENEHVGQAQNCDLVEYLDFVATRILQRPDTEEYCKHDHCSEHLERQLHPNVVLQEQYGCNEDHPANKIDDDVEQHHTLGHYLAFDPCAFN